jgi:hypothetical protein
MPLTFLLSTTRFLFCKKSFVTIASIFQNMIKRTPWTIFLPSQANQHLIAKTKNYPKYFHWIFWIDYTHSNVKCDISLSIQATTLTSKT